MDGAAPYLDIEADGGSLLASLLAAGAHGQLSAVVHLGRQRVQAQAQQADQHALPGAPGARLLEQGQLQQRAGLQDWHVHLQHAYVRVTIAVSADWENLTA